MAYPYKTIGAATVSTILAVGTLLWWQRTTRPDMPRSQDEAEIMTAVIERHAAMGRTVNYLHTIPANVSQIITGSVAGVRVSSTADMLFDEGTGWQAAIGYNYAGFYAGGCAFWQLTDIPLTESAGVQTGTIVNRQPNGYYTVEGVGFDWYGGDATITHPTGTAWRVDVPYYTEVYWLSATNQLPQTLPPYYVSDDSPAPGEVYGVLTIANHPIPVYEYRTNSPAATWTNTVGLFPNAEFQYPDGIRAALEGAYLGDGFGGSYVSKTRWILPEPEFLQTGDRDSWTFRPQAVYVQEAHRDWSDPYSPGWYSWLETPYTHNPSLVTWFHFLDSDTNYWTNYVTLATAHRVTQTNYWDGTVIGWTNGVAYTNQYPPTNSGSSVAAPSTNAGHRSTTNYSYSFACNPWTGGTYTNAGGCVDGIQPKSFAFERDNSIKEIPGFTPATTAALSWSTNVYNDMGRALSLMQWQTVAPAMEVLSNAWWYITGYDAFTGPFFYTSGLPVPGMEAWAHSSGGHMDYNICRFGIGTNDTVFGRTNITLTIVGGGWKATRQNVPPNTLPTIDSFPPYMLRCFTNAAPIQIADYQAPGQGPIWATESFPRVSDLPTAGELANFYSDFYAGQSQPGEWNITFVPYAYLTYRVVFQSLTNYTDHAPAR